MAISGHSHTFLALTVLAARSRPTMHVVLTIALVLTCMWSPVAAQLASCVASTPCSAISNDSSLFLDSLPFSNASRTFLQCSLPDSDLLRPVFTEYCTVRARSAPAVVSSNNCGFGALSLVPSYSLEYFPSELEPNGNGPHILPFAFDHLAGTGDYMFPTSFMVQPVPDNASTLYFALNLPVGCADNDTAAWEVTLDCDPCRAATIVVDPFAPVDAPVLEPSSEESTRRQLATVTVLNGPYIQALGQTSLIIIWRMSVTDTGTVALGTSPTSLTQTFQSSGAAAVDAYVYITGLQPATTYYYSISCSTGGVLASGSSLTFTTFPTLGTVKPLRMLMLGDPGTGSSIETNVMSGARSYMSATGKQADVVMMLGDDAYTTGSDAEYSSYTFGPYKADLPHFPLYTVLGNHDTSSTLSGGPYFTLFPTPRNGEAGGVPSNSGAYYSYDYGNVHVIGLDSYFNSPSPTGPMATWLKADLANLSSATTNWVIVIWHHPPYSKGGVDSDTDSYCTAMRANILPICEQYGIDLVLGGHSHNYERSLLVDGLYGKATSFTSANLVSTATGSASDPYIKPLGVVPHKGTISIVAGSSGRVDSSSAGLMHPANAYPGNPPASLKGTLNTGSFFLDVNGNTLTGTWVSPTGTIQDQFFIVKQASTNNPASVTPTISNTPTQSPPPSVTATSSPSLSNTKSVSVSTSLSVTRTPSTSATESPSITASISQSSGASASGTSSPAVSPSNTPSASSSLTSGASTTRTPTSSVSPTDTSSSSPSLSTVASASKTSTPAVSPSNTPAASPSPSSGASASRTPSITITPTTSPSDSNSNTASITPSSSPSSFPSQSQPPSVTSANSPTASITPSISISPSLTSSPSITPSGSGSASLLSPSPVPTSISPSRTPTQSKGAVQVINGPYVQSLTQSSTIVISKLSPASAGYVAVGTSPSSLSQSFPFASSTTVNVTVTGLTAGTQYYYGLFMPSGVRFSVVASFTTLPPTGTTPSLRFFAMGDIGTGTQPETDVITALQQYATNTNIPPQFLFSIGNAAYLSGSDSEYSSNFFKYYNSFLNNVAPITVPGNLDQSSNINATTQVGIGPYFKLFYPPHYGEAGGVPSNTGDYYSFNYGSIHVVCLDSYFTSSGKTGPMGRWLQADLASLDRTKTSWLIVMWHHAPYSMGSSSSDVNSDMVDMRSNLLPICEQYGVDLVLGGHSLNYERSQFVNGSYGLSTTFNQTKNVVPKGDGSAANPYTKPLGLTPYAGEVCVVAGSGGSVGATNKGLNHPANVLIGTTGQRGSMTAGGLVVDVVGNTLTGTFVTSTGTVLDTFTIVKTAGGRVLRQKDGEAMESDGTVTEERSEENGGRLSSVSVWEIGSLVCVVVMVAVFGVTKRRKRGQPLPQSTVEEEVITALCE